MVRYVSNGQGNIQKQIAVHGSKDVEATLNGQGKIDKTYHYSPNGLNQAIGRQDQFAKLIQLKATSLGIAENPFQYSGEYRDTESHLDYLRARYYDPQIQRFIQRDSYQLLNRYAYVKGNPIMHGDPSGHHLSDLAQGILIGAAVTVVGVITGAAIVKYIYRDKASVSGIAGQEDKSLSLKGQSKKPNEDQSKKPSEDQGEKAKAVEKALQEKMVDKLMQQIIAKRRDFVHQQDVYHLQLESAAKSRIIEKFESEHNGQNSTTQKMAQALSSALLDKAVEEGAKNMKNLYEEIQKLEGELDEARLALYGDDDPNF